MKILVTGATGFVGQAIVTELLQKRFDVYCLGNTDRKDKTSLPNFYRADIRNYETLRKLEKLGKVDVIIHTAGLAHQFGKVKDEDFWKTNVDGTKNTCLLATKLRIEHFVLISSVAVYGKEICEKRNFKASKNIKLIDESDICKPDSIYALSKLESEKAAREICEREKISLTILRPATVLGEGDEGNVSRLIKAIDKNRFFWLGSGENYKSLIYKGDVARACRIVLNKKSEETEVFNLTAEPLKMSEIVGKIASCLKKKIPKFSFSDDLLRKLFKINVIFFHFKKIEKLSNTVEKWLSVEVFSGERIKEEYGFYAETPIVEAIRREVEFYKNHK